MNNYNEIGVFRGRELVQKRGKLGGSRSVFVKLQGIKNELVYPTFGGIIRNPFKGPAKGFAGDLCWYKTNSKGVNPEIYILKTYEVISASGTTVNIFKDNGYRHTPFVNDILMKAPDVVGGTGTGVKITAVSDATVTVSEVDYDCWAVTTSSNIASSLSKGDILVEATATGSTTMLVETVNSVMDCDCDFFDIPKITADTNVTTASGTDTEFDAARYLYTPALGAVMYTHKMSPVPDCIKLLNRSNVNGWFKINYYDMRSIPDSNTVNSEIAELKTLTGSSDPTSSTAGAVGQMYVNSTDGGTFICTGISGTTSKTYTWREITFTA